jgi:hypothetical protein
VTGAAWPRLPAAVGSETRKKKPVVSGALAGGVTAERVAGLPLHHWLTSTLVWEMMGVSSFRAIPFQG